MKPRAQLNRSRPKASEALNNQIGRASAALQLTIQISTVSVALWSLLSFIFSVGYISRIDKGLIPLLSLTDLLGISLKYSIYFLSFVMALAIAFLQFSLPVPEDRQGRKYTYMGLLPFKRISKRGRLLIALAVSVFPAPLFYLDNKFHFIDRSSFAYQSAEFITAGLLTVFLPIFVLNYARSRTISYYIGTCVLVLISACVISYVSGDYAASLQMNHPTRLDCAILKGSDRCIPALLWGDKYFVTWAGTRSRVIPVSMIDHVWAHPYQQPDKRIEP